VINDCRCSWRPARRATRSSSSASCRVNTEPARRLSIRINGGLKMGDEALMDGVSMQEGTMSQGGMVSFFDFPLRPTWSAK